MAQRWLFDLLLNHAADRATFKTDSNVPKTTPSAQIRKGFDDVCTA